MNNRGHVWKADEAGVVDIYGMDADYHNGPICTRCGYGYCHHCHKGPQIDCPGEPQDEPVRDYDNNKLSPEAQVRQRD